VVVAVEAVTPSSKKVYVKSKLVKLTEEEKKKIYRMNDSCSRLEILRAYQLAGILGKYKLF